MAGSISEQGTYFKMVYGLWGAFYLRDLPRGLDDDDLERASMLCDRLVQFIQTGICLKWIEIAIIINYHGRFVNLFDHQGFEEDVETQQLR